MKKTLITVATLTLVACGAEPSSPDAPAAPANGAATPLATSSPADERPAPAADDTTTLAAARPAVAVVLDAAPGALDFDLRGSDVFVLRAVAIDRCSSAGCAVALNGAHMPPTTATQANASLAITTDGTILVAQKGSAKCYDDCTIDEPTLPGLFAVGATKAPTRLAATMPLAFAKAFRETDGWLVGRADAWAVEQSWNNESFTIQGGESFVWKDDHVTALSLGRGYNGPSTRALPFVFAQATTLAGPAGYANTNGALTDLASRAAVAPGFVAQAAAVTANAPASATLVVHGRDASDGLVTLFDAYAPKGGTDVAFPGITPTDGLFATTAHIAFFAADEGAIHACTTHDVASGTCHPTTIATGLESIVRVRTRGDQAYVLGLVGGTPRLVLVTF